MNPGDRHASEAHTEGTHELVHVLAGALTVTVGDQAVELGIGDSMSFPGDVDHGYANHQDGPARFSLTVYEPGVGSPETTADRRRP